MNTSQIEYEIQEAAKHGEWKLQSVKEQLQDFKRTSVTNLATSILDAAIIAIEVELLKSKVQDTDKISKRFQEDAIDSMDCGQDESIWDDEIY